MRENREIDALRAAQGAGDVTFGSGVDSEGVDGMVLRVDHVGGGPDGVHM